MKITHRAKSVNSQKSAYECSYKYYTESFNNKYNSDGKFKSIDDKFDKENPDCEKIKVDEKVEKKCIKNIYKKAKNEKEIVEHFYDCN